jgi:hypothetical protein
MKETMPTLILCMAALTNPVHFLVADSWQVPPQQPAACSWESACRQKLRKTHP